MSYVSDFEDDEDSPVRSASADIVSPLRPSMDATDKVKDKSRSSSSSSSSSSSEDDFDRVLRTQPLVRPTAASARPESATARRSRAEHAPRSRPTSAKPGSGAPGDVPCAAAPSAPSPQERRTTASAAPRTEDRGPTRREPTHVQTRDAASRENGESDDAALGIFFDDSPPHGHAEESPEGKKSGKKNKKKKKKPAKQQGDERQPLATAPTGATEQMPGNSTAELDAQREANATDGLPSEGIGDSAIAQPSEPSSARESSGIGGGGGEPTANPTLTGEREPLDGSQLAPAEETERNLPQSAAIDALAVAVADDEENEEARMMREERERIAAEEAAEAEAVVQIARSRERERERQERADARAAEEARQRREVELRAAEIRAQAESDRQKSEEREHERRRQAEAEARELEQLRDTQRERQRRQCSAAQSEKAAAVEPRGAANVAPVQEEAAVAASSSAKPEENGTSRNDRRRREHRDEKTIIREETAGQLELCKTETTELHQQEVVGRLEYGHAHELRVPARMYAPHPREKHSAVLHGGHLFVFAGAVRRQPENSLVVLNVASRQWRPVATAGERPPPLSGHTATEVLGRMVVVGGFREPGLREAPAAVTSVGVLDLATMKWTLVAGPTTIAGESWCEATRDPNVTRHHSAVAYGGSIYVFGGVKGGGVRSNDLDVLDLRRMQWISTAASKADMGAPPPRALHTAVALEASDEMVIFGGIDAVGEPVAELHAFHFASHTYRPMVTTGTSPSPRSGHSALAVGADMYIFGGATAHMTFSDELFVLQRTEGAALGGNAADGVWKQITLRGAPLPARQFASLFLVRPTDPASGLALGIFGGGGVTTSEYCPSSYAPTGSTFIVQLRSDEDDAVRSDEKAPPNTDRLQVLRQQAFTRRRPRTAESRHATPASAGVTDLPGASPARATLSDEQLLRRYSRFNEWRLTGDFPAPMPPPNLRTKEKLTPDELRDMANRLSRRPDRAASISRHREELAAEGYHPCGGSRGSGGGGGIRRTVDPRKVAEQLYERSVETRSRNRERLLRKYLPKPGGRCTLSPADVDGCTQRLHAASISKTQKVMGALRNKYISQLPQSRQLSPDELQGANERLYKAAMEKRMKERQRVHMKYIKPPVVVAVRLGEEQLRASAEQLHKGTKREPVLPGK